MEAGDLSEVPSDNISPEMWILVGEPDRAAADLLEEFTDNPAPNGSYIWDPVYDSIRDHPAYLEALRLVNLEGRTPQRTPR